MDDRLILDNYLLILKSTVEVFVHGTLESSNLDVKELLQESLNETLDHQKNTYEEMVKYGWYQVQNIENNKIQETLNKVNQN